MLSQELNTSGSDYVPKSETMDSSDESIDEGEQTTNRNHQCLWGKYIFNVISPAKKTQKSDKDSSISKCLIFFSSAFSVRKIFLTLYTVKQKI